MKNKDTIAIILSVPVAVLVTFAAKAALGWAYGVAIAVLYLIIFLSCASIARLGKNKKDKATIWLRGGALVLVASVVAAVITTDAALHEKDIEQREYINLSRTLLLMVGSTFGASIIVRGVQYAADDDLTEKALATPLSQPNQAPLPTPVSVTPAANAPVAPDTGAAEL
jgi:hypothetical protein